MGASTTKSTTENAHDFEDEDKIIRVNDSNYFMIRLMVEKGSCCKVYKAESSNSDSNEERSVCRS